MRREAGNEAADAAPVWSQRVGGLIEVPALLRQFGVDPAPVLASVGLPVAALADIDGRIPFGAADSGGHLVSQLQRALRLLLLAGKSSGDELAQTLSLHRRTLSRRLRSQGTTFQKVLDEVRFEIARELLERTHTPIEEVAAALCYADVSAFMHAFRRWTGTTPAVWRKGGGRP